MNRENKRKQYEKGYYKHHPCSDHFICRKCGRLVVSAGAGSSRSFTGQEPGGWEAGIEPIGAGQTREFGSRFEPGQPTGGSADG